jgi:hypothetical protein
LRLLNTAPLVLHHRSKTFDPFASPSIAMTAEVAVRKGGGTWSVLARGVLRGTPLKPSQTTFDKTWGAWIKMQGVQAKAAGAACTCGPKKVAVTLPSKAADFFGFVLQIAKLPMAGLHG